MDHHINKPSSAFIAASWLALIAGAVAYLIGLFNADMQLNEKGYYLVVLLYALFASVSLQKVVRDKLEGLQVTPIYYALCWVSIVVCVALLAMGLWNASLLLSEKGFYMMAFLLSLFGAVAVQKNIRDLEYLRTHESGEIPLSNTYVETKKLDLDAPLE